MAELGHRIGRVGVMGQEQRGEGVTQFVGRQTLGQRSAGSLERQFFGLLNHRIDHSLPGVIAIALRTPCRWEHRLGGSNLPSACQVGAQLVAEHGE